MSGTPLLLAVQLTRATHAFEQVLARAEPQKVDPPLEDETSDKPRWVSARWGDDRDRIGELKPPGVRCRFDIHSVLRILSDWHRVASGANWATILVAAALALPAVSSLGVPVHENGRLSLGPEPHITLGFETHLAGGTAIVRPASGYAAAPPHGPVDPLPRKPRQEPGA